MLNVDEDSDSSGDEFQNPVAKDDTNRGKYMPPSLAPPQPAALPNLSINDSQRDPDTTANIDAQVDALETASNMSQNARNDLAREAAAAVLEAKEDPDMLNKVVP